VRAAAAGAGYRRGPAAVRPGFPLAAIAAGLRGAAAALDPFGGTDLATDVRAVFS
jgi:hypothetical protein